MQVLESIGELLGKRVAVFGLSGNPPTGSNGHCGIVNYLVQTELFDELWILPVFQHMYSTKSSMIPYEHRVNMCKISMENFSSAHCRVRVMTIEKEAAAHYEQIEGREYRVGTVDILDFILSHCPELQLHLVLGTDTFKDLTAGKWKESDRILNMVTLHVISRQGIEVSDATTAISTSAQVVHHHVPWLTDVSSSQVRAMYSASLDQQGRHPSLEELLDPRVLEYIKMHDLYTCGSTSASSV